MHRTARTAQTTAKAFFYFQIRITIVIRITTKILIDFSLLDHDLLHNVGLFKSQELNGHEKAASSQ